MFVEEMRCRYSAANCGSRESTNARSFFPLRVGPGPLNGFFSVDSTFVLVAPINLKSFYFSTSYRNNFRHNTGIIVQNHDQDLVY